MLKANFPCNKSVVVNYRRSQEWSRKNSSFCFRREVASKDIHGYRVSHNNETSPEPPVAL